MKECIRCRVLKGEKEFINDKGRVVKICIKCREYRKEYYARNRDQIKEQCKEHYERNKEYKKEYDKEYRKRNKVRAKERVKEYKKEYYARNKERIREYRKRNKVRVKEYRKEYYKRSAKYETYAHRLTVEESPKKGKNGKLLVRCTKCGSFFTPTIHEVQNRISSLEGRGDGERRLYCSLECKDSCEIYGISHDPHTRHAQFERDPQWAKMVKERAKYTCERCGSKENLEAHHEVPVKVNPELVSDEDNGICLCHECHMKAHSESGCTLADLRNL